MIRTGIAHQRKKFETYVAEVYSVDAIRAELANPKNIYYLLYHDATMVGYSKMQLDQTYEAPGDERLSKMDQIYLSKSVHGMKLGAKLMNHNIEYSKAHAQRGMWLVVWVGNALAISFYEKFGF